MGILVSTVIYSYYIGFKTFPGNESLMIEDIILDFLHCMVIGSLQGPF